jgi:hypothetical protein
MADNAFFWIGLLAFMFVLWVSTGGPSRPISFAGPYLTPISTYGDRSEAYGDEEGDSWISSWDSFFDRKESQAEFESELEEARAWGEPSPYRGQISLGQGEARESLAAREYVEMNVSTDAPVNVTGWKLVSGRTGASATIGYGTEVPRRGSVNMTGQIMLEPGDQAIVVTGRSPLGVSFRENMCVGYLDEFQRFEPPLRESCPNPSEEFENYFGEDEKTDTRCYEIVTGTAECRAPKNVDNVPSSCTTFVKNYLNYNGCVTQHQDEREFRSKTWRIYLGAKGGLWRDKQEMIKLLDAEGRTVDLITY